MSLLFVSLPHFDEEEDVEEVHSAEDKENEADLGSEDLEDILVIDDRLEDLQIEDNEAEVDEVKADDEQVVDAVGEFFVSLTAIDQKDAAVFVQGSGNPNRERQGDGEIESIG